MYLTQQIQIKRGHEFFAECDSVCFLSKNLYNHALFRVKKHFNETGEYLDYFKLYKILADENQVDYRALPQNVSAQILIVLHTAYKAYFKAVDSFYKNPELYKNIKPKEPNFKRKTRGRFVSVYPKHCIKKKQLKIGIVELTQTNIKFKTIHEEIQQIRIIPRNNHYIIELLFLKEEEKPIISDNYAGLDMGLNNLATIGFNNVNIKPIIVSGKPLKSINQFYNKVRASQKVKLHIKSGGKRWGSKRTSKTTRKRNNKIKNYLHKSSRKIVDYLKHNNVSELIIGHNKDQKQNINIGDKNNQNFVLIPYNIFIDMLIYKCKLVGISTKVREESYTSKCSFADNETIRKHNEYKGKRIKRGLFQASNGFKYNADLNGALNILKKEFPKAFDNIESNGIEGLMISPTCLQVN